MSGSIFVRLMSATVVVANHAGRIVREIMKKGDLGIVEKGVNDLQTEADRSVQRCIINSLSKQFPKVTIIGEETLEKEASDSTLLVNLSNCEPINVKCPNDLAIVKEEDIVVWVDPLDGTAEYTQGLLDHVTVLIGVAVNGKAVGGVIHQPFYNYQSSVQSKKENEEDYTKLGRTMWGVVGAGAHGIIRCSPPENKKIVTTTRSHSNAIVNSTIAAINPDEVLKVGGAGHKVLLLIEGKAHAYVFPSKGMKKWDTCAPEALLHAFGGKLTDIFGKPIKYHAEVEHSNSTGVLATYVEAVHDFYTTSIPKETKEALS